MNSVYFDKKQIEAGLHTKLINFLIEQSYAKQDGVAYYNDIRIKIEDIGAISVEWNSISWDYSCGGSWQWIEDGCKVMREVYNEETKCYEYVDED